MTVELETPKASTAVRQRSGGNKLLRFIVVRFLLIFPTVLHPRVDGLLPHAHDG